MKPQNPEPVPVSESTAVSAVLSQPALEAWGRSVGEHVAAGQIPPPLVVALRGPLGAGKSVLARAIARGAGVDRPMPSPTYNLVFVYEGAGVAVHHLDLYRLEDPDDVWELGWQELDVGRQIVLIEWPDRAEALLPTDRWEAELSFVEEAPGNDVDPDALRRLEVRPVGAAPVLPELSADPDGGSGAGVDSGSGDASGSGGPS